MGVFRSSKFFFFFFRLHQHRNFASKKNNNFFKNFSVRDTLTNMRLAGRNGNFGGEESSWARFTCRLVDGKQDNNNINQEHTCASLSYGGLCSEDRLKVANLRLDNTASKLVLLSRKRVTSTQLKTDILDWFEEYIPQKAKKAPTQWV